MLISSIRRVGTAGAVAALVAGLGLAGCGASEEEPEGSDGAAAVVEPSEPGTVKQGTFKGKTLIVGGPGGLYEEAVEENYLAPFAEASGATVVSDGTGVEPSKVKVMVESGNVTWDAIIKLNYIIDAECGTLFEKLNVDTSQTRPDLISSDCSVPLDVEPKMLVYNKKLFADDPPTSMADFFDTTKYPGKRSVFLVAGNPDPTLTEAVLMADGVKPEDLYPLDYDRLFKKLDSIRGNLLFAQTTAQQQQQVESDGDIAMAWMLNARAAESSVNGAPLAPVMQPGTVSATVIGAGIPKGGKNPAAANALINFMIGTEPSSGFSAQTGYSSPNVNANVKFEPPLDEWVPSAELLEKLHYPDAPYYAEHNEELAQEWADWLTG